MTNSSGAHDRRIGWVISTEHVLSTVGAIASHGPDRHALREDTRWWIDGYAVLAEGEPIEKGAVVERGGKTDDGCHIEGETVIQVGGSRSGGNDSKVAVDLEVTQRSSLIVSSIQTTKVDPGPAPTDPLTQSQSTDCTGPGPFCQSYRSLAKRPPR